MSRVLCSLLVGVSLAACQTDLGSPSESADDEAEPFAGPAGLATDPVEAPAPRDGATTDGQPDDPADERGPDDAADDQGSDDAADGQGADEPGGDDDDASGGLLPPAELEQACTVWQDCGPHFGDRNSGFDCHDGQCACNVDGDYDDACAAIGGLWSDAQCFCFVTSSRPPEDADPDETDQVTCWWDYYRDCEADEWVDTSYYRNECDDDGCRRVYVRRGYWREGHCDDVWVRECSDGTRQTFR